MERRICERLRQSSANDAQPHSSNKYRSSSSANVLREADATGSPVENLRTSVDSALYPTLDAGNGSEPDAVRRLARTDDSSPAPCLVFAVGAAVGYVIASYAKR